MYNHMQAYQICLRVENSAIYVSKCSTSIQIPHIQTVLTKHIKVAALGNKM